MLRDGAAQCILNGNKLLAMGIVFQNFQVLTEAATGAHSLTSFTPSLGLGNTT
jgi:hypothetical protein